MNIDVKQFLPADGILLSGDRNKAEQTNFNQSSGPAFTLFLDGEMVCAGGARLNVAEMWFILSESVRARLSSPEYAKEKKAILQTAKEHLELIQRDERLYRLYAEARTAENFCETLGFKKKNNIFVR